MLPPHSLHPDGTSAQITPPRLLGWKTNVVPKFWLIRFPSGYPGNCKPPSKWSVQTQSFLTSAPKFTWARQWTYQTYLADGGFLFLLKSFFVTGNQISALYGIFSDCTGGCGIEKQPGKGEGGSICLACRCAPEHSFNVANWLWPFFFCFVFFFHFRWYKKAAQKLVPLEALTLSGHTNSTRLLV